MTIGKSTLHEFARNADGETFDGRKVAQWLFEAMTGKPMSDAEAQRLVEDARSRAAARKAPPCR
jgi:site-specific recombinase XerD